MPKNRRIIDAVSEAKGELLSAVQIAEAAAIPPGERKALQQRLRELTQEGILEQEGRRFRIAKAPAATSAGATPSARAKAGAPKVRKESAEAEAKRGKGRVKSEERGSRAASRRTPEVAQPIPQVSEGFPPVGIHEAAAGGDHGAKGRPKVYGERRGEVVGLLTLRPEGYGFVKRLEGPPGEDVFLPPHELRDAMNGDRVRVRVVHGKFGRDAGVLLEIVAHRRQQFLGVYGSRGQGAFVVPVDPTLPRLVPVKAQKGVRPGQVVKVNITAYPSTRSGLQGEIERVVGEPDDPIIEVLEVAYAHGFAEEFPAKVRAEAARIPDKVRASERQGRRDLKALPLVTIDSEDARDFDDAICVERLPRGGYRLVVAIADVAHYVQPGSSLDDEAFARATSVYFPNHVLPMLPEKLSNGICSLNPEVERLCMVADLALDASGKPVEVQLYEGVMSSHARLTYTQVAKVLRGETPEEIDHLEEDLLLAGELASKLRAQRKERGALDFDLPEAHAILNDQMLPISIERRERNDAHRLIEEFMLAANEAVARHFSDRDLPTVYRVHDQPDPEKLERFANLAQALGFHFDVRGGLTPKRLGELLREIEGSPQQKALNTLLLRSLMQAIYQPENIGHYGLAAEHYLHFTSPIRRYPDLVVHRLLKEHWARAGRIPKGSARDVMEERLEGIAAQSSERERAATEAERDIDQFFKCLFIQDRVGETFAATVIAITDFGFFAELDEVPVEGLVRADELGANWDLDEARYRLVFPGTGRSFGMGDQVQVSIAGVDLEKRQVSLRLLVDQKGEEVVSQRREGKPGRSPLASAVEKLRRAGAPAPRAGGRARTAGGERAAGGERSDKGKQPTSDVKKKQKTTKQRPGKRERSQRR